jgi:NAD+ kinase
MGDMARIGLVVHPTRDIDAPIAEAREWAATAGSEVVQVTVDGQNRRIADPAPAADCDLILAIGGDGTTLAAIHAGAAAERPVLGVACGSLGVLTSVPASEVGRALTRFVEGDWTPRPLPALEVARGSEVPERADGSAATGRADASAAAERAEASAPAPRLLAFNDIAMVREGSGQVRAAAEADGVLFCRLAGDGCIVSTHAGSSAYTIAAGGPLLAPGVAGFVLTPLPAHGAACPPLVLGPSSRLRLFALPGHGGARLEVDGQVIDSDIHEVTISYHDDAVVMVRFDNEEPALTGLRRRRVIRDSARILADDTRG